MIRWDDPDSKWRIGCLKSTWRKSMEKKEKEKGKEDQKKYSWREIREHKSNFISEISIPIYNHDIVILKVLPQKSEIIFLNFQKSYTSLYENLQKNGIRGKRLFTKL